MALFPRKINSAHRRAPERKRNLPNLFLFRLIIRRVKESEIHLFFQGSHWEHTYLNRFYDAHIFQHFETPTGKLRIIDAKTAPTGVRYADKVDFPESCMKKYY